MSNCTSNTQPELSNSAISLYLEEKNQELSSNALGRFSSRKQTDDVRPQSASSDDSHKFLHRQEPVDQKAEFSGEKKKKKKKKNRKRKAKKNELGQSQIQPHNISMISSKNSDSAVEEEKEEQAGEFSEKVEKNAQEVLQLSPLNPPSQKQSPDIALEEVLKRISEKEKAFGEKGNNSFKECVDKEQASFPQQIPVSNIDEPEINQTPQVKQPNEAPPFKKQMIAEKKSEKDATVHNKYWKTRICFDHQNKRCKKSAEECNYAHGKADLRPLKNKKLQKEEGKEKKVKEGMCYKFVSGMCKKSQKDCQYLHDQQYANRKRNTEKKEKESAELKYLKQITEDNYFSSSFNDAKAEEKRKAEIEAINQAYIIHQPLKSHPGFAFPREPQPYPPSANPSYCIPTYSMPVYFPYWNHPMPDMNAQMPYQYPSFPPNFQNSNYPLGQNMGSNSSASNFNPNFSPYYTQPSYLKPEEKNE